MRVRKAFFAESRNIGNNGVLLDIVRDMGGDGAYVERALTGDGVREKVKQEFELARSRYGGGTPTLMLPDGTRLEMPMATPRIAGGRIIGVRRQTCLGDGCRDATRALFEQALAK